MQYFSGEHAGRGMNCFLETTAFLYLFMRDRLVAPPAENMLETSEDSLLSVKRSLQRREAALVSEAHTVAKEAQRRRRDGDIPGARSKIMEWKRTRGRLGTVRGNMAVVEKQLDVVQNSELQREIMESLRTSTAAMRKAGLAVDDVENVMSDLDSGMRESAEVMQAMSTNTMLFSADASDELDESDLADLELVDSELASIMTMSTPAAGARTATPLPSAAGVPQQRHHVVATGAGQHEPARSVPVPDMF